MKNKFLVLSLIMVLIITLLSSIVMAATYSFTVSMTANNSKVASGNEVLITVKLSNLNVGENGINSFSAYLSYDTDVFETLTDSSVDGVNGWVPSYTTGTGKVSLYRPTFLKTDEEIMTISLKTKSGLVDGTQGEVKLSTIIVSNSSDEIMASPVSTNITIGTSTTIEPVITNPTNTSATPVPINTTITPSPKPVNNVVEPANNTVVIGPTTNTQQNQVKVVNESNADIPYTGTDSNALAKIIIGVIFIGLVIYIKIERMDKEIR